jgi:hypothetical protein
VERLHISDSTGLNAAGRIGLGPITSEVWTIGVSENAISIAFSIETNSGMDRGDLADLTAFVAVADRLSFRAADFREKYLRARELQADILADEVIPIVNGERPVLNKLDDGTTLPNLDTVRNNILGCHNPKQILPECEVPIEYYQP